MIQLASLSKAFGDRVLFEDVSWHVDRRERVGLCGPNGAGKTTLLRVLADLDEPDRGAILKPSALTVGYLPQDGLTHAGRTLADEAATAFQALLDLKDQMHALEARLGDAGIPEPEHDRMLAEYSELQDRFRLHDGYTLDLKVSTVLRGLGFRPDDLDRPTETFSGGWQMRIALAKLLLGGPDLLLLDEPTNHLDLEARNWLEDFLVTYAGSVILVSHDRFFLDAVVTRITEVGLKTLTDYPGTYSTYVAERDARLERLREAKRRQDEETARMRQFIDRFRYQATKAAQVQSRIKMLEKVVPIEIPPERKRVHFSFPPCRKSGRMVLELRGARKAYGSNVVFRDVTLHIERGDRIALVGPNGAGKSTLMRMLAGVEPPDAGTRAEGHEVVTQYFAQDEATRLDPSLTVHETLAVGSPTDMVPMIRNILGGFLFTGDDVYKGVAVLSGGERTRLAVARMLLRPSNTLLMDEPTNHLDLDSKDVLLDALVDFGGTLIFVSHDRYFVDRLATKVVEVGGGEAVLYPGTYEEFHWSKVHAERQAARASGSLEPARGARRRAAEREQAGGPPSQCFGEPGRSSPESQASGGRGPRERGKKRMESARITRGGRETRVAHRTAEAKIRRNKREIEARRARIAQLEAQIAERELAIKELEASMATPDFFANHEVARPVIDRHQSLMWEVGDLLQQWEDLQITNSDDVCSDP